MHIYLKHLRILFSGHCVHLGENEYLQAMFSWKSNKNILSFSLYTNLNFCLQATAKLPTKADLSNCHLEFLPETVFISEELENFFLFQRMLNLMKILLSWPPKHKLWVLK